MLDAPTGQTAPAQFTMPFSDLEVENFLLRIGATNLDRAEGRNAGLRVRLRLSDCPELADLPWEYLYDRGSRRFLALSEWTPVVRYLEFPGRVRPLPVSPPLRVLVLIASPTDFPRLDVSAEWDKLREALGGLERAGRVLVERVPNGTLADLQRQLRRADYHVFHYIGHGGYDTRAEDGVLTLEGANGRGQLVSGGDLGVLLHDHRTLRLAVLNSCEGSRGGRTDPYSGTAQSLIRQGIPAVVAMQFGITDQAAITFSHSLYEAVADGYPLDAALAEARKAVRHQPNPVEWGTRCCTCAPDGHIFDLPAGQTPPVPSPPTPPPPWRQWLLLLLSVILVVGGIGVLPLFWDSDCGEEAGSSAASPVLAVAVTPDGERVVSGSEDRTVKVWDLATCVKQRTLNGHTDVVWAVAVTPDGERAISSSADDTVKAWDLATGAEQRTLMGHTDRVKAVAVTPDGRQVLSGSDDDTVKVWDLATGAQQQTLTGHTEWVSAVAVTPGGGQVVSGSEDGTVKVWDLATGVEQRTMTGHTDWVRAVAVTPGGERVVSGSEDGTVKVWELATGVEQRTLTGHTDRVSAVAVTPDGERVVSGDDGGTLKVWDLATGTEQRTLTGHTDRVKAVAIIPDGEGVVSGSDDGTVKVWDLATGAVQRTLTG